MTETMQKMSYKNICSSNLSGNEILNKFSDKGLKTMREDQTMK